VNPKLGVGEWKQAIYPGTKTGCLLRYRFWVHNFWTLIFNAHSTHL